jgi:thiamine pyrophosphate-dependent acetolactate synthase large subunit-like protein
VATAASELTKRSVQVFNRAELTKKLVAKLKRGEAVVGGIGNTNFDLYGAGHRPENFYMLGSMGLAVPIALGVAIAQPQRGVIALEGDGSILMSLGCLSTVAQLKPRNLTIIIIDNGMYQITGKQPTTTRSTADIVEIARASGIENSSWIRDEAHFDALIDRSFADGGPFLLAAKIDDQPGFSKMIRDPALIRNRFMKGLGTGRGGALDE